MRKLLILLVVFVCLAAAADGQNVTEGSLFASDRDGKELGACPLKTTVVRADISGFLVRVNVRQEFENKFSTPIEAVYVFPLSQKGAVDRMTMTVGSRTIRGKIMRREEARQVYEAAKTEGKAAALLDQERPNIFTQSVANIMPGESVIVEISYVETLAYDDGAYEFVFPMTVGPRYIPASVIDAANIRPPVAATRAGHDISIEVNLNAGVPVEEIRSTTHQVDQVNRTPSEARITLRGEKTIPNKDFILRYDVTGKRIEDAVLAHRNARGGFFTMILQPPDGFVTEDRTPKEIVFVLDTSGSMYGFPIEKAKEAMRLSLDGLYPDDTFNLITFAGDTHVLFGEPVYATQENLKKAQAFLASRSGGGGTEMMKAIKAALDPSDSQQHLRIVCFMTDGYVGNEEEIIAEVKRHANARVFSFGIGSSVNRHLLDKIAEEGKGEVEYVGLQDDGSKAAKKFYERVRTPLLTDLSIDWSGMPVADVYPAKLTDLFSAKPVVLHGRYTGAASGTIKLRGKVAGQPYERSINVNLPAAESANDVLATLWARTRIDELSSTRLAARTPKSGAALDKQIASIGLEFGLMTAFTSFVAVEDRVVNQNGLPVTVQVPVELPEGVDAEKTIGKKFDRWGDPNGKNAAYTNGPGSGGGMGTGSGGVSQTVTLQAMQSLPVTRSVDNSLLVLSPGASPTKPGKTKTKSSGALGSGQGRGVGYGSGSGDGDGDSSGSGTSFVIDRAEVSSSQTGKVAPPDARIARVISGGVLNGNATYLPKPEYPGAASAVKAKGTVAVRVIIDETGNVVSAKAVSGHPLLRGAAVKAALAAKFAPTSISDIAVKISGVIAYNFIDSRSTNIAIEKMKVEPLSAEEAKGLLLKEKLHAWLYAIVVRAAKGDAKPAANESLFIRDGKAEVRIVLNTRSAKVIDMLKAAGFEIVTDKGKTEITGRISLDKIAALAEIDEVRLILPRI